MSHPTITTTSIDNPNTPKSKNMQKNKHTKPVQGHTAPAPTLNATPTASRAPDLRDLDPALDELVALRPLSPTQEKLVAEYKSSHSRNQEMNIHMEDWPMWLEEEVLHLVIPMLRIVVPPAPVATGAGAVKAVIDDYCGGEFEEYRAARLRRLVSDAIEGELPRTEVTALLGRALYSVGNVYTDLLCSLAVQLLEDHVLCVSGGEALLAHLGVPWTVAESPHGALYDIVAVITVISATPAVVFMYRMEL